MTEARAVSELVWTVGDRLRKARETAGLDQNEMAAAIGVARSTVSNAERNAVHIRPITLRAWSLATGVPVQYLENGTEPPDDDPTTPFRVRHQGLEPRTRWLRALPGCGVIPAA